MTKKRLKPPSHLPLIDFALDGEDGDRVRRVIDAVPADTVEREDHIALVFDLLADVGIAIDRWDQASSLRTREARHLHSGQWLW